jgi:hypothetical protein
MFSTLGDESVEKAKKEFQSDPHLQPLSPAAWKGLCHIPLEESEQIEYLPDRSGAEERVEWLGARRTGASRKDAPAIEGGGVVKRD